MALTERAGHRRGVAQVKVLRFKHDARGIAIRGGRFRYGVLLLRRWDRAWERHLRCPCRSGPWRIVRDVVGERYHHQNRWTLCREGREGGGQSFFIFFFFMLDVDVDLTPYHDCHNVERRR